MFVEEAEGSDEMDEVRGGPGEKKHYALPSLSPNREEETKQQGEMAGYDEPLPPKPHPPPPAAPREDEEQQGKGEEQRGHNYMEEQALSPPLPPQPPAPELSLPVNGRSMCRANQRKI